MVTYDTLIDTTQEEIYSIVKNNATVSAITTKVIDGLPYTSMQDNIGFPYVQVQTPTYTSTKKTFSTYIVTLTIPIVCFATKASVSRELTDAVRKAITDGRSTTTIAKLDENRLPSSTFNQSLLNDGKTILYQGTVNSTYQYWGEIDV
jgi:hypothetical protein